MTCLSGLKGTKVARLLALPAAVALVAAIAGNRIAAQQAGGLEVVKLQDDFYMFTGAGANIAVQIGADGVILVDTGSADAADRVLAEIRKLTSQRIRYIINTNADADHVGGNELISAAGLPVHQPGARFGELIVPRAPILAEEHVQARMSAPTGTVPPFPVGAWPTNTYSAAIKETQRNLYLNGQGVQVFYQPSAHTDGDSIVFFRRSDIMVLGDVMDTTAFPMIDVERGGSVQGVIDSLNRVLQIAIPPTPFVWQEGGTMLIPGHGRVCLTDDVVFYRDMVTIVRDRVRALAAKGMTLAQIQQANPTAGYTRRYGATSGRSTTAMFVEAVHKTMGGQKKAVD